MKGLTTFFSQDLLRFQGDEAESYNIIVDCLNYLFYHMKDMEWEKWDEWQNIHVTSQDFKGNFDLLVQLIRTLTELCQVFVSKNIY